MVTITAAELQKSFGRYREIAQREPVSITYHGYGSVVMLSQDEFNRLKSLDTRQAYYAHELPEEWVKELVKPYPAYKTDLDHLMK